jgi:23S rRNA (uracil1939-C5)-methyltransferase
MVLDEHEQQQWKRTLVAEALAHLGGVSVAVEPTIPSPRSMAYRNKVEFSFGRDARGRRILGLHAGTTTELVDIERCLLQDDSANHVLETARAFFLDGPGAGDPAVDDPREPLRLVVRRSFLTRELLAALRGLGGAFPSAPAFARRLMDEHRLVRGVVRLVARPRRRGGTKTVPLAGRSWIAERLGGTEFHLPASTFFQVNPEAAERVVDVVGALAGEVAGRRVLDLYAGVGVFGLALARLGARVTLCEADPEAVRCGEQAAVRGLDAKFVNAAVAAFLARGPRTGRPDVVVANPPRAGLGREVVRAIAGLGPQRIILVSCDPATLARDLGQLVGQGYRPSRVQPVDLFPQTPHVETVSVAVRA